jgi:hypothetical protein
MTAGPAEMPNWTDVGPHLAAITEPRFEQNHSPADPPDKVPVSVRLLQHEVDEAVQLSPLQRHPALQERLSQAEMDAERRLTERIRTEKRAHRERKELKALRREIEQDRVDTELANIAAADARWHRRAVSKGRRLTDPNSRLASLARGHRATTWTLYALVVAGVAWTAVNVQHTIVGDLPSSNPLFWLSFGIEPLISVPLIVLMKLQSIAAQWGRTRGISDRIGKKGIVAIEVGLLLLTVFLNSASLFGKSVPVYLLVGHMIPPIMVATSVLLQPLASDFFGRLLAQAYVEVDPEARMPVETAEVIQDVARIRRAIIAGDLTADQGQELPSIRSIQRFFAMGKRRAQLAHDALKELDPVAPTPKRSAPPETSIAAPTQTEGLEHG